MTFLVRTDREFGVTAAGRIVPADDPTALGVIPAGRTIPIDDAERLGITTEAEERAAADTALPSCPTCGSTLAPDTELAGGRKPVTD